MILYYIRRSGQAPGAHDVVVYVCCHVVRTAATVDEPTAPLFGNPGSCHVVGAAVGVDELDAPGFAEPASGHVIGAAVCVNCFDAHENGRTARRQALM